VEEGVSRARLETGVPAERFVPLRRQLGVSSFGLNQIVLGPGERGRIHRHREQEEVYLVLDGTLDLLVEGETTEYGSGELIRIAPGLRRQLVNRGPHRLALLALGGAGEHAGRDGEAFRDWQDTEPAPPQEIPLPHDLAPEELRGVQPGGDGIRG
jgi:mannose-6-phosphate isomerase-like protein (cupin superfamily)